MQHPVKGVRRGVSGLRKDASGEWYLPSHRWLSEPATADITAPVRHCPTALLQQTPRLVDMYRRHRDGVQTIAAAFGKPSNAAVSVIETFGLAEARYRTEQGRIAAARAKARAEARNLGRRHG